MTNHHTTRRKALGMGAAALLLPTAFGARASNWPNRPIKLVVPGQAGSGMDIFARMLQVPLQTALKQPIVIDNKAGANSLIGNEAVARAAPDGYTFLFTPSSSIVLNPIVQRKMPYDTLKDLLPVAQVGQSGILLIAHPSTGFKSLQDVVRHAKAYPGALAYGSWGSGSSGHLAMEGIKDHFGIDMPHVPYKGTAALLNDLLGNNIKVAFTDIASPVPHVRSGKLTALAATGSRRCPALPNLPTVSEQGYPFSADGWYGVFAPARTPSDIVQRMNAEINKVLASEETVQRFLELNMPTPPLKTAAQFASTVSSDMVVWQNMAKGVNLTID